MPEDVCISYICICVGLFLDSNMSSTDILTFDLLHVAETEIIANCNTASEKRGSWHQWQLWELLQKQNSNLSSIQAELESFRACNSKSIRKISDSFSNGNDGLRRNFNRKVFDAIQSTFRYISPSFEGKFYNS